MARYALLFALLLALFLPPTTGCSDKNPSPDSDAENPLRVVAPFLSASEASLLSETDPAAYAERLDRVSTDRLIRLSDGFLHAVFADSAATDSLRAELLPPYRRVVDALAELRECPEFRTELDYFLGLELQRARQVLALSDELDEVFGAGERPLPDRLARLAELQDLLSEAGYERGVSQAWSQRGALATRTGRPDQTRELFTQWLEYARAHDLRVERCNALASLIMQGFAEGNTDSVGVYLDRGLELANESRLAAQTSRLLALTGYRDFTLGHYSAAVRSFERAVDVCRNYGDPAQGLSHLSTLMRMYAAMESWTLVDQVAERADILMAEAEQVQGESSANSLLSVRFDEIQARALMARGRVEEADAAYNELWERILPQPYEEASFLAHFWIMGLLDHDRPDLAATALARAEPYAEQAGIRHMQVRIPFWKARTFYQLGEIDSATVQLDRFAAEGLKMVQWSRDLQIPYYALRCRLSAATDRDSARVVLAEGMQALAQRLAENDAGAGAFLDLSRARGLRWAAHDEFGADPATGYGLELMWREYMGIMGHAATGSPAGDEDVPTRAGRIARDAQRRLGELDATHLLYQVREPWVVRWTVDERTVRRDTLAVSSKRMRELVGRLYLELSTDPGDQEAPVGPELAADLETLAQWLLPPELFDPARRRDIGLLLVSGESFLSQIPFAPLDVAAGADYEPLAASLDLGWVRNPAGPASARALGEGLLIANPEIDPMLVRRYRNLAQLVGAGPEILACRELCPGRELSGRDATKQAVTEAWSSASIIYFLGHVIHNPEVPFLTTIPLTPPAGPHLPIEAALDISDVRSADLGACRLAVLSGCGSGAPFADGVITAPSLGDAFLDAGCGASLQTFWRIRDEEAVFRPEEVVRRWEVDGMSLPRAVSAERRAAMQGPTGMRHPFGWGAWTLKLESLAD